MEGWSAARRRRQNQQRPGRPRGAAAAAGAGRRRASGVQRRVAALQQLKVTMCTAKRGVAWPFLDAARTEPAVAVAATATAVAPPPPPAVPPSAAAAGLPSAAAAATCVAAAASAWASPRPPGARKGWSALEAEVMSLEEQPIHTHRTLGRFGHAGPTTNAVRGGVRSGGPRRQPLPLPLLPTCGARRGRFRHAPPAPSVGAWRKARSV